MNDLEITVYQGATFRRTLTIKDSNGLKVDITGRTFRGMARAKVTDALPAFEFDFTISNQTTNRGEVVWELTPTDSTAVVVTDKVTMFHYDVEMVVGADVTRILQGRVKFIAEITK